MNDPGDPRDDDQRQLQALFDATAHEPDPGLLDRLARAAARLPEAKAQPWWHWLRWAVPATLATALALALWLGRGEAPTPGAPTPVAETREPAPSELPSALPEESPSEDELALEYDQLDDDTDALDELDDDPLAALEMSAAAVASPSSLLDLLDPEDDDAALEAAADGFNALLEGG